MQQPGKTFHCNCCGNCCRWPGIVRLTEQDITSLSRKLNMTEDEFIQQKTVVAPDGRSLILDFPLEAPCVFLDQATNLCRVHEARPQQCRNYPATWDADPNYQRQCQGSWT